MPQKCKNHTVLQKGDYLDCGNYRTISLLNFLSKVCESVLYKMMSKFFVTNTLFNQRQFGFRSHRSCAHSI